jgi:lipoate-protein ligase A
MEWTAKLYGPVFGRLKSPQTAAFELKENDYVFGQLKFGGNAQSIVKDRWLHHTSFLWDFQSRHMEYLAMPEKRPEYRQSRTHGAFLTRLKDATLREERGALFRELESELAQHFQVHSHKEEEVYAEVIEEKLGGLVAWAEKARTKNVCVATELLKKHQQQEK